MALTPGTRIGGYEIAAHVGSGGMGEVYRARDTQLHRDAAIKVLPSLFARDPERLARFEREARTLAALNHPNVAQVYQTVAIPPEGGSHSQLGLVMEFVDGEDLSQRIARAGALPLDEALPIARQVAEALEAAHAQSIVHRDLKPANVKVRVDGQVKVLDFGLAKALAPPDAAVAAAIENSPTVTSPFQLSQLGVVLGTAAYMAPEQAKGKAVDKRADIWAFGCLLYEMLTGVHAFPGDDVTETLAAIIRAEPDWSRLPPATPPSIATLLRRCLEKDPRERLPDIGAARLEIRDARIAPAVQPVAPAPGRGSSARLPWAIAAAGVVTAIAALAYHVAMRPAPDTRVYKSIIVPPAPLTVAPVRRMQISPDGRRLALVAPDASGRTVLWIRPLDDAQAQPLRGTEGAAAPFWSPDSRWIAFQAEGKLKKVEATGGTVTTIGDVVEAPPGTWSRDNVILTTGTGVIMRRSSAGGPQVPVTVKGAGPVEPAQITPFFLPDGRHFLYALYATSRVGTASSTIHVGSLDSTESTRLLDGAVPQYANGYLLFLRGSVLLAQRFDPDRLALSGEAVPLAEDVQVNAARGTGAFSVSQTGDLVFQAGASAGSRPLAWFDRAGKTLGTFSESGPYGDLQLSPDGRWASATRTGVEGRQDVWLVDVARNQLRRLTVDGAGGFSAVWRPGSARVVYGVRRGGSFDLVEQAIDGSGKPETVLSDGQDKYPVGFSADGNVLLYSLRTGRQRERLWTLRFPDRTARALLPESEPWQQSAEVSPDGRAIAYTTVTDDGVSSLYVASFPDLTGKREVSSQRYSTPATPHWRRDGKELFYTAPGRLMAVDVDTSGALVDVGVPHPLFEVNVPGGALGLGSTYAPSPDGQRFLLNIWESSGAPAPITLVVNWPATLRR